MSKRNISGDVALAASEFEKEKKHWLEKLSGDLPESIFPYDHSKQHGKRSIESLHMSITGKLATKIKEVGGNSNLIIHLILMAAVDCLLYKYTSENDILTGVPIYKQEKDASFVNTVLPVRALIEEHTTFKEMLIQVREAMLEANDNQNYPMETLLFQLDMPSSEDEFPLFDVAVLLENIHDKKHIEHTRPNILFNFRKNDGEIGLTLEYNALLYERSTIERIAGHFRHLINEAIFNIERPVDKIDILLDEERTQLLYIFNDTRTDYPAEKTIDRLFEEQVEKTPGNIALVGTGHQAPLSYSQLNEESNRLAHHLIEKGVGPDTVVALLIERSRDMIVSIMGILKAGGAYLPLDPTMPEKRLTAMMNDSDVSLLLTETGLMERYSFCQLQENRQIDSNMTPVTTCKRERITDFDTLPHLDRSLVDYEKYIRYIGQGMVRNSITIQATRGCPYDCAYCCRVWPRKFVTRSAEDIYAEVKAYYDMGVRRFVFIDDIFNLNKENSSRFFRTVIDNNMKIDILFPSGLRADILTEEYIDLMVEAGVISFPLSLETASHRLQKYIKKHMNIETLQRVVEYICEKHPQLILELNTMHGFPTETEEEAMQTLNFIKEHKGIHFPYVHILKFHSNTDMEQLAIESGIPRDAIVRSQNLAYHELPDTLPFEKSFTTKYQADYFAHFMDKERLLKVLPYQMKALTEDEIVQKYNSFLPVEIKCLDDLLEFIGITTEQLGVSECKDEKEVEISEFNKKLAAHFPRTQPREDAIKVLLLDVTQDFEG
ncbi:MAG: AMP-binding protein, partial [bacterium]|nr:AMP-binding protein [bacterium]